MESGESKRGLRRRGEGNSKVHRTRDLKVQNRWVGSDDDLSFGLILVKCVVILAGRKDLSFFFVLLANRSVEMFILLFVVVGLAVMINIMVGLNVVENDMRL